MPKKMNNYAIARKQNYGALARAICVTRKMVPPHGLEPRTY